MEVDGPGPVRSRRPDPEPCQPLPTTHTRLYDPSSEGLGLCVRTNGPNPRSEEGRGRVSVSSGPRVGPVGVGFCDGESSRYLGPVESRHSHLDSRTSHRHSHLDSHTPQSHSALTLGIHTWILARHTGTRYSHLDSRTPTLDTLGLSHATPVVPEGIDAGKSLHRLGGYCGV